MGEVVNVLVAFAVIVFVVRWVTSGALPPSGCNVDSTDIPRRRQGLRRWPVPLGYPWFQTKDCNPGAGNNVACLTGGIL